MQEHKASIAIFHKSHDYAENVSTPYTPNLVFEAAQRVMESKGCELVRGRDGMYIVQYSETGPFKSDIGGDWLPVFVMRLQKWNSGGIRQKEMQEYQDNIEKNK